MTRARVYGRLQGTGRGRRRRMRTGYCIWDECCWLFARWTSHGRPVLQLWMALAEHEVYGRIGEEGFARLLGAFYRRVRADDLLGPMYPPEDWEGAEGRLREFLIFRFG